MRVELRHGGVTVASRSTDGAHNGHVQFSSASLAPGIYAVSLAGLGGYAPTPTSVTVVAGGAQPSIAVTKQVYAVGEPIGVSWRNDPGNRYDWLSVNAPNGTPLTLDLLEWRYVNSEIDGHGTIGQDRSRRLAAAGGQLQGVAVPRRRLRVLGFGVVQRALSGFR